MTFAEGLMMSMTLTSITLILVIIIFFFIRRHLKHIEKQKRLDEVDNPTKHL